METLSTVMPIILCALTSILVIILIILGIRLLMTLDRIDAVINDVEKKVKTLNGFFGIIDTVTDKVAFLSDKVVDVVSGLFTKILSGKKKEKGDEN